MNKMIPPTKLNRRHFLQLTGGVATLALVNACAPAAPVAQAPAAADALATDQPQRGGVLRVALSDDVTTFDPAMVFSVSDVQVATLLYNALLRQLETEPGMPTYPELADAWEVNETATTYTFHLRQGVTFQHGTPFTTKDVEYTINRLLDPALGSTIGASLGVIERMELVDDFTIIFHLKEPNVTLLYFLRGTGTQIVPHDRTTEALATEPSGTGPFVLAERTPGERTVLKRNEQYWEPERPYLDEVQFPVLPEPTAQIAALTGGTVDLIFSIGVENIATLENSPDVLVLESNQGNYPIFIMRVDQDPFTDLRVRQAFKHAVDRAALRQALMFGRGLIGNDQPIDPSNPFWADVQPLAYDVEKAKALLAEAGYADGLEVTLATSEIGGPRVSDAAIALQEMLKAVGVTITLDKVPANTFYTEKYMQVPFVASWWPTFGEPDVVLSLAYSSQAFYNETGWIDPKLDELIAAGRAEQDDAMRKTIYTEVQQLISEQGGVIIPYFAPFLQAATKRLQGHIPGPRLVYQNLWLAQA